ncbi:MAG: peptide ABC transporter substrate-binding protein [Anaerolineaceae bacterium]|nr:peptide ABC transporter substrate-binding protein [Anaerolineaceae bacterium]
MRSIRHTVSTGFSLLTIPLLLLVSCRAQNPPPPLPTSTQAATPVTATQPPVATPTQAARSLVICLGQEPLTLFPYGQGSATLWSVLEAVYDGPIDQLGAKGNQAVILQKLPSLQDKDASIQPVSVAPGQDVVDANGNLVTLAQGVIVRPSGCTGPDCAKPYDGKSPLQMDQMTVRFSLLPGVTWSDGTPLKASDSVYSFKLAADPKTPVSKALVNRTSAYKAVDDTSVEWTGVPGFIDSGYPTYFWMPLPEHLWGSLSPTDLQTADLSAVRPVGWGAYVIDEWVRGDHISLHKNPNYFRAKEGLPKFDALVFRFIGQNSSANTNPLLAGECDLVDRTGGLDEQLPLLAELDKAGKLKPYYAAGPEWEHLDFGIKPASYDDGFNPAAGDRPNFFGDVRTRQAFAYCADRQGIVDKLLYKQSRVPASYAPQAATGLPKYEFNPQEGARLLEAAGWKDPDKDPATPRIAQGVSGVPDGTPFTVVFQTTQAPLREKVAQALQASLGQCGLQVKIKESSPSELFAPGPEGPLFGRQFDLAQFSWAAGLRPACFLYASDRIPNLQNHWVGENVSGYTNPEFDRACRTALLSRPDQPEVAQAHQQAQEIFARDLPVLPLYLDLSVVVTRPDFCGFTLIPEARSELWGLEVFDDGPSCGG